MRGNKGGRTAGVDGVAPRSLLHGQAVEVLTMIRRQVKTGEFRPWCVARIRSRMGRLVRSGIPTPTSGAALAKVHETKHSSGSSIRSGFHLVAGVRRNRRLLDFIKFTSRPLNYEWVFEADITACYDEIDHTGLIQRLRGRITDKRVLALVEFPQGRHPQRGSCQ